MNHVQLKKTGSAAALIIAAGLCWNMTTMRPPANNFSPEKVNLALRRTAHYLLAEAGDSTSRIPPVQQTELNTWQIRLEHAFNYDRLPVLLQASLDMQHIQEEYNVAVLNCADSMLQLGYNNIDFSQNNGVPCGGREVESGCYIVQVTFPGLAAQKAEYAGMIWWLLLAGAAAVTLYVWGKKRQSGLVMETATSISDHTWLSFGNSRLDTANQLLICGGLRHQLTYREAKLLHLFVSSPNQLLERSFILEKVWADEGILVGRSVDVFVSRLRKILRDDQTLGLVAVHGVGYRLEVA